MISSMRSGFPTPSGDRVSGGRPDTPQPCPVSRNLRPVVTAGHMAESSLLRRGTRCGPASSEISAALLRALVLTDTPAVREYAGKQTQCMKTGRFTLGRPVKNERGNQ